MCFPKAKGHFCLLKFAKNSLLAVIGVREQKLTVSRARTESTPCARLFWHSAYVINQRGFKMIFITYFLGEALMFEFWGGTNKSRTMSNQKKKQRIMLEPPVSARVIYCMALLSFLLDVFVLFQLA